MMYKNLLCRVLGLFTLISLSSHLMAADAPPGAIRTSAWNIEKSEFPTDESIIYGKLPNGLSYAIRPNDRPQNEVLIRMAIEFGSAAERDNEQGLAHFIEHMAFNGSTNVPEGEMIKILERLGLSFGPDTNASTGYTQTTYTLDLPNPKLETVDTALFLLRETASEVTFDKDAVDRERGIIIEEKRVRENFSFRSSRVSNTLFYPDTFFINRYPIGKVDIIEKAPADRLKTLYKRYYTPDRTKLIIVGPIDPIKIEKMIVEKFSSWEGESRNLGDFDICNFDTNRDAEVGIFTHPEISETINVQQFLTDKKRPSGINNSILRFKMILASAIISNRINRQIRNEDTKILGGSISNNFNICENFASVGFSVSGQDGSRDDLIPFLQKHINSALTYGFQKNEVDEIIKHFDTLYQNSIKSASTRQSRGFARSLTNFGDNIVSSREQDAITWLQIKPFLTPHDIHKEFQHWFGKLQRPLIFHTSKSLDHPDSNDQPNIEIIEANFTESANTESTDITKNDNTHKSSLSEKEIKQKLLTSFNESLNEAAQPLEEKKNVKFAYTSFGQPSAIIKDRRIENFDIRAVEFENGVKLNIKTTDFEDNRVRYSLRIAGGELHFGKDQNILAGLMSRTFTTAALGQHDIEDLRSVILGSTASPGVGISTTYFGRYGSVAPNDLLLQMQLLAAFTIDPGYREEALRLFKRPLSEFYDSLDSNPSRALSVASGKILTNNDPRFSVQEQEAWEKVTFDQLRTALGNALTNNALEIGVVGDISEEDAIAAVSRTFGAMPKRTTHIPAYETERNAVWSDKYGTHDIYHKGEPDQLAWQRTWTTDDDSDFKRELTMNLLAEIIELNLTEVLRETLGASYGSSVTSSMSGIYKNRGTFSISTSGDAKKLQLIEQTIDAVIADVIAEKPSEDIFKRARTPNLESYKDWRTQNRTWIRLVDEAQSDEKWPLRFSTHEKVFRSITREDIWNAARKYLSNDQHFTFRSLPEGLKP